MSRDYLDPILDIKQQEIKHLHAHPPKPLKDPLPHFSFFEALSGQGVSLIAELKRASPSKGMIRHQFDPVQLAHTFTPYASALSVLTETSAFLGHLSYLEAIKRAGIRLPLLRKDFLLDPIQIEASYYAGADAILLIASILTPQRLAELHAYALSLHLDVLVEVHTQEELDTVITIPNIRLLGINNRNLDTFDVDISTTKTLTKNLSQTPYQGLVIAESGYNTPVDLSDLKGQVDAVLIGEGLAKSPQLLDFFDKRTPHEN